MDIKDNEFFRLEERMLFEAAAAANIVAAADAAQDAGDDGNNDENKNNNDLNVALFVAPEVQNDNDEANANVANAADIDAQAKAIVEGALPAMDDAIAAVPAVDADADADADADVHADVDNGFVEGTLHVDNADSFTVDADADADHDILGNWLANDDIDANANAVSVDGAVAAIAAEHTVIDIDADADADADSDDFNADTRAGDHDLSIDFTAHKVYDGTNDVENDELQMDVSLDGVDLSVSGIYHNDTWTFSFSDDAHNNYLVMVQDVTFDGNDVTTDSITIGSFTIDGGSLSDVDVFVNGEELVQTRAAENLRADGVIDQREITISVRDAYMTYGDDEGSLKFHYDVTQGELLNDDFVSARYTLSSELDAYRTSGGNIQYSENPYEDVISVTARIFDVNGVNVTSNYSISTESADLYVSQRVLSVTIQTAEVEYGQELGDTPKYVDKDGNPSSGYTYDNNGLVDGDHFSVTLKYDKDVIEANKVLTGSGNLQSGLYTRAVIYDEISLDNAENYRIDWNYGTLKVTPKVVTVDYNAANKIYDGNTDAKRDGDFILSTPILDGDVVRLFDTEVEYNFAQPDVGTDIEVTATDNFIAVGKDALNYDFRFNLVSKGDITPKDVTITFTAADKVYDGNTDAAFAGVDIDGLVAAGDVTIDMSDMTYAFDDKNAGTGKTVTAEGYSEELLGGARLQNYNVTFTDTALANITPLAISVGFTADDKIYDGNTDATRDQLVMDQVLEGDDVSFNDEGIQYNFDDKDAGTGKTVTATGYDESMLSGADLANYNISFVDTALANITPLEITIGFIANDKVYDGNTEATRDQLVMDAVLEGDDVQFDDSALEYNFDNKNVGDGKTVTATGFDAEAMLSGADLANYDITFVDTALANITPLEITIGFTANDKVYDGNTEATRDQLVMDAVLEGDDVQFDDSALKYNFDDKNAGTDKTVTATGYDESMLSGGDLANYDVTFVDTALADITPLAISIGFTANNKPYDGNTTATRDQLVMDQVLDGDDVQFDDSAIEYNFDTKEPGEGKTVTATGYDESMLSGADLANYDVTFIDTTTADITFLSITIIADDKTMIYGDANPSLTYTYEGGLAEGHSLSVALTLNIEDADITNSGHIKAGQYADSITAVATVYDNAGNVITGDYSIEYDFGNLTVDLRNIAVTAKGQSMVYGAEMPDLTAEDAYSFDPNALASGDMLAVTLKYDIPEGEYSASGNVNAGLHSGAIVEQEHVLDNDANYNYTFNAASLTVTPKDVTVSFNANDKIYDGNTDAARDGDFIIDGFVEGDAVRVFDADVTYAFDDKNAGTGKTVTAAGELVYVGNDVDNYNFTFDDTAEADITPLAINIGFTADDKIYDGNTDATRDQLDMSAVLEGDDVQFDDSALQYNFDDKNAGEDKTVTATGFDADTMLSGDDLQNYDITFVDTTTADITKLAINIGFTANDKVYDGNTDATRDQLVMDQVLEGDDVQFDDSALQYNFDDKNAGTGKTVTATGYDESMLSGGDLANYDVTFVDTATADITPLAINIGFTAKDKMYDGNTDAARDQLDMSAVLEGDDVQFDDSALQYNFDDKNAGTDKTVTATGYDESMLSGGDLANYDVTFVDTAAADITPLAITVIVDDQSMIYGDAQPSLTYTFDDELAEGDDIQVQLSLDVADSARTSAGNIKAGEYEDAITAVATIYDDEGNVATGNYEITYDFGKLTVDLRNITVTAKNQQMTYGDDLPGLDGQYTYDGNALVAGDSLEVTLTYEIAAGDLSSSGNVAAGLHPGTVVEQGHVLTNGENYNYTFNAASLNVVAKDVTVSFNAQDKAYDGSTDARRDGDFIIDGVVAGDEVRVFDTEIAYAFDAPTVLRDADGNVLDRTVTAKGELVTVGKDVENYNITFVNTAEAKITPLVLTVTAIDQSMTYGDANPDLAGQYTVEGLLDSDTLDVTLAYDSDNIPTSASGHFKAGEHDDAIVEGSHTLTNAESYDYIFNAADLKVEKRPVTIVADDKEITYGDEVGELTYTVTGDVADGDSIDDTTLAVDGEENANGHYNAGEYDIVIGELSLDENDYDITYDPGTLLVNQKEITVIADDKTKEEHKPDPRLTYTVDGLLDDDTLTGRLTREPGEAPGEYEIQQGTLTADDNYIITYIPGTLTITEKPDDPEPTPPPRNIYQEPEQSNRNYNGPMDFEVMDYRPVIPDMHPKWDFRSRFEQHRIDPVANSQDLWMDLDSLDTILVSKVVSASNSANERGFSSGNEMFPNDTQTPIISVHQSDDFDAPLIDYIDVHGSNDADMPWIFMDESIQIPKFIEQDIADDAADDMDMLDTLAGINLNEPSKHAAFKSDVELLLDGLMA